MGKIEKTLELNITHELITIADSFWYFLSNISLRRYWRPTWKLPILRYPRSYVTGLPLNIEGKAGGGYDVCLHSPKISGSERLVFIQFKAGEHSEFNENPNSIFYGSDIQTNPHIVFTFNNNKKKNQHILLQDLAASTNSKGNPVLYAFPRIIDEEGVKKNAGRLLVKTSFISTNDIDIKALNSGFKIQKGKEHYFRSSYNDYNKNEVNWFVFPFDGPDQTENFISEIVAIRVMRAFEELKNLKHSLRIYMTNISEAFIQFIRNLVIYLGLNIHDEIPNLLKLIEADSIRYILTKMEIKDSPALLESDENDFARRQRILYSIVSVMKPFFNLTELTYFEEIGEIPEAPNNFTFNIPSDSLRIPFNKEFEPEDFEEIRYSIF